MNQTLHLKRPAFIIFTDKDGTMNLQDKNLNTVFKLVHAMNGMMIPTTGRTVGDIQEDLKGNKLINPVLLMIMVVLYFLRKAKNLYINKL